MNLQSQYICSKCIQSDLRILELFRRRFKSALLSLSLPQVPLSRQSCAPLHLGMGIHYADVKQAIHWRTDLETYMHESVAVQDGMVNHLLLFYISRSLTLMPSGSGLTFTVKGLTLNSKSLNN